MTAYMLGHAREELERLDQQGAFLRPSTRALLLSAGLQPGMRVLDYGTGTGDVAFLARELVGVSGEVVGLDRSAEALGLARARAAAKELANVSFVEGDEARLGDLAAGRPFDAIVGRLVLIHQRDPLATVRELARFVRPGGVLAFHEVDYDGGPWTSGPNPLLDQLWRWIGGLLERGVFPRSMGVALHEALAHAGLDGVVVTREGRLVRDDDAGAGAWVAGFARSIQPLVMRMGLAGPDDRPLDELVEQRRGSRGHHVPATMVAAFGVVRR